MTWKTHLIGGAEAGVILACANGGSPASSAVIIGTAMLGSVLPDIDHQKSKLAQGDALVGLASSLVCRFTKHRGFTHTIPGAVVFAAAVYILMMFSSAQQAVIAMIGACSGFLLLQLFGTLRRYSVILALAAYMFAPRIADFISGRAHPITFSPETARLAAIGVFAGCISHMAFDLFNRRGVPLFWPFFAKPLHLASIKTRGTAEGLFAAIMLMLLVVTIATIYRDAHAFEIVRNLLDDITAAIPL